MYVPTAEQLADGMTKDLPIGMFRSICLSKYFCTTMSLMSIGDSFYFCFGSSADRQTCQVSQVLENGADVLLSVTSVSLLMLLCFILLGHT